MHALEINDTPTVEFRSWLGDFVGAWGDVNDGGRFPIRIGRKYATDNWRAPWRPDALLAAFSAHKEEIRALAEAAFLGGKRHLHL